jgi:HSP20 family protein
MIKAWSSENGLIIAASMPGIDSADVEITIDGRTLTLSGSRPEQQLPENARTHRQERAGGRFDRTVELPYDVDADAVVASYENGILQIELPRVAEDKPRRIAINKN